MRYSCAQSIAVLGHLLKCLPLTSATTDSALTLDFDPILLISGFLDFCLVEEKFFFLRRQSL
jgi:hypothetical protein